MWCSFWTWRGLQDPYCLYDSNDKGLLTSCEPCHYQQVSLGLNGSMLNFVHYFNSAVLWYINDWISMFIVKNKASGFYFGELINLLCKMQLCCCHLCIRKSPFNRWTAISVTSSTCWTAMGCLLLSYIIHIKHFPQKKGNIWNKLTSTIN